MSESSTYNRNKAKKTLSAAGFTNVAMLRDAMSALSEPSELAELVGVNQAALMDILESPELSAIDQLGGTYLVLLHDVGIYSVAELSQCDPFVLQEQIENVAKQSSVRRVPNRATLEYWIEQARELCAEC